VAATVEVGQVDVGAERHVAGGELGRVRDAQMAVVVKLVLAGDAGALVALHGKSERHLVAVLGLNTELLAVVELVKDGDGGVVLEGRLDDSVDAALLHADRDRVVSDGALAYIVAGGKANVELVESHDSVEADLWRGAQARVEVDAHFVVAEGLLELAWHEATVRAEGAGERGLAQVGGETALAELEVAVVASVPRLLDCHSGAVKVALERGLDGGRVVIVRALNDHVDAVALGFHFKLDIAKVVALAEEVRAGLSEVVKFWWSHGRESS